MDVDAGANVDVDAGGEGVPGANVDVDAGANADGGGGVV